MLYLLYSFQFILTVRILGFFWNFLLISIMHRFNNFYFFFAGVGLTLFMLLDCYFFMCNFLGIQFTAVIKPNYFGTNKI
jgi:hypothetical protein